MRGILLLEVEGQIPFKNSSHLHICWLRLQADPLLISNL
jgi:hypothetical protein